jgi:DNA-directed RNA polymerase subunit RPC12/RpoP
MLDEGKGTTDWVDGNAAAGLLATVFTRDATRARIVCAACGRAGVLAEQHVFALEMGAVIRCPACSSVTLRLGMTTHGCFLDMRGAEVVHFD